MVGLKFCVHENHQELLLKHRLLDLTPQDSDSVGLVET